MFYTTRKIAFNGEKYTFIYLFSHYTVILGKEMKEGNVLFNDTLNTFYLRLYCVGDMVKDHSYSERGNPLLPSF